MEKLKLDCNGSHPNALELIKTKPLYAKKTFLWELESIEQIIADGAQRSMFYDLEVIADGKDGRKETSKWRLTLDVDTTDLEPAITVKKLAPLDKTIYFRLAIHAMKSPTEESDVISFPNTKLFYEGLDSNHREAALTAATTATARAPTSSKRSPFTNNWTTAQVTLLGSKRS